MNQQIAVYNEFRGQLAELKAGNEKFVFDYESPKGNKEARSHIYKLRQTKAAVDKARKEEKAASLEYGKRVDAEAKEIIGEIEQMIAVHQGPLDAIEQREKDRRQKHEDFIAETLLAGSESLQSWMAKSVECLTDRLKEIESEKVTEERFEEYTGRVAEAKDLALTQIREAISHREKYDAQQAEIEAARKAAIEREQKERDERIAREAAERAIREAEERAKAERDRAEAEARKQREAAERKELELKLQAEQAERQKADAERRQAEAEQRAKDAEKAAIEKARIAAEQEAKRAADDIAAREANRKHVANINNKILAAFVEIGLSDAQAKKVISAIAKRTIPHVSISY